MDGHENSTPTIRSATGTASPILPMGGYPYPKDYYDNGRGSSVPGVGPNQLLKVTQPEWRLHRIRL
ncbi:MAG: hypothetical protein R3F28_12400 [Candidatus Kapaibacterium sp.]